MSSQPKPGSKPYRNALRSTLRGLGFGERQIVERVALDLIQACGCRPRQAWRLACELALSEVAARYNVITGDPNAPMRQGRIWEFEQWPAKGTRPTVDTLKILAQIFGTTWDHLVDLADLERMPSKDRNAYHDVSSDRLALPRDVAPRNRPRTDEGSLASWTVFAPSLEPGMVDRAEDLETLIALVTDAADPNADSKAVAVSGPGGFGKTTLATQACHDPRVARLFTEVLWVETGEQCTPGRVVQLVSDLCVRLDGNRPTLTDADQAGFHFAQVLADRRVLLVIDNVWSAADLAPFLLGGPNTVRLVTTRNARTCPSSSIQFRVGPMSESEVRDLLGKSMPGLHSQEAERLAQLCRGWPLLASVVGSAIGQDVAAGASPERAVDEAGTTLDSIGPQAFDVWDSDQRRNAIGHAITASLSSLEEHVRITGGPGLRERYLSLAIFPAATPIPLEVLSTWWGGAHGWTPSAVRQFCRVLADRSLIDAYLADRDAILLHDVFRAYLRHLIGGDWAGLHRSLVDSFRAGEDGDSAEAGSRHGYMRRHLTHHLHEAELTDELADLLSSPAYIIAKTTELGHESLLADLAVMERVRRPQTPPWRAAAALIGNAFLLHGLTTEPDIAATLLAAAVRTDAPPTVIEELRALTGRHGIDVRWTLNDQIEAAGHIGAVTSLDTTDDLLVSGGEDGTVRLWRLSDHALERVMRGHTGWVYAVAISPDKRVIASAGDDRTIRLWNLSTGEPEGVLLGHTRRVRALAFTSDGRLVSGAEDGLVLLWSMETASLLRAMRTPGCPIWSVAVASDDALIAATGEDEFVRLYDPATGELVREEPGHRDWIRTVDFHGQALVTGAGDHTVRVWTISDRSLSLSHTIDVPSRVRAVAAAGPDVVIAAGEDATVRAYNPPTLISEQAAPRSVDWIRSIALGTEGAVIAGCEDGSIRIFDGRRLTLLCHGSNTTWSTGFSGPLALMGRADGAIAFRSLETGRPTSDLHIGSGRVWSMAATSAVAVAACGDGAVRLWSTHDDWTLLLNEEEKRTWSVAINQAGTHVAASSSGGIVRVWDLPSGRLIWEQQAHRGRIRSMAFDHSGRLLLTGGGEGTARLWRLPAGELVTELAHPGNWVRTVSLDPQGTHAALGCGPGDIYVHDLATGHVTASLHGHTGRVLMIDFTSTPDMLVSAAADGTIRTWSLTGHKQLAEMRVDASLQCAAFGRDTGTALVASATGTVALKIPATTHEE
ncbi:NB-ARC domain-containing protein [Thermomonospora umbrina]|uniref:WD-40 repeat-containing protein n=1 Tax=Thermomonospora umbrina TaxID=111806 RepID=A0A3D9SX47_9ACTN|nr:NB-ARC domain-containing protein [Thermomonospora umbrina]REF00533.1 WD-40 repeat-containing protein [Thermomonospora umbrina]